MNKKFVLLAFASVFLLLAVIGSQLIVAVAALRTVGVSEGDWAEYGVTFSGNGTMPPGMENVTWVKITVQEISGTNITFEMRARYPDDTEETETYVLDVDTGQGNATSAIFIAANLNAGDLIYNFTAPGDILYGMTINETITRSYMVGNVEVNHWNLTMSETIPEEGNMTRSMDYCWYRATGMITEMSMYYLLEQVGNMTWLEMEVVIIGIIPEFPPAIILPLFMIATLTAVWLGKIIWSIKKPVKKPSTCA